MWCEFAYMRNIRHKERASAVRGGKAFSGEDLPDPTQSKATPFWPFPPLKGKRLRKMTVLQLDLLMGSIYKMTLCHLWQKVVTLCGSVGTTQPVASLCVFDEAVLKY